MKKLSFSIFAFLGVLTAGCNTDIDADELDFSTSLTQAELCNLSGGVYQNKVNQVTGKTDYFCACGEKGNETPCGPNVNCRILEEGHSPVCGGVGFTFLTEGLCTMNGVEVCSERIGLDGKAIGYYTQCVNNRWTDEKICLGKSSCQVYKFSGFAMSSRCGECQNDGEKCIGGKDMTKNASGDKNEPQS